MADPGPARSANIERDPRCAFGIAIHGYDVALEGRAVRVTDDAQLQRLAKVFADERGKLEEQWSRGDDVSTEDLRVALTRYRSFFERLLST